MLGLMVTAALAVMSNVRTTDSVLAPVLADGLRASATIRRLVAAIDASDVIVYLARGECPRPAVACVMMAGRSRDTRYVRINVRLPDGPGRARAWHSDELSVMLAHELQHVVEIALAPEIVDGATLQRAFAPQGRGRAGLALDTREAVRSGDERRRELRDSSARVH